MGNKVKEFIYYDYGVDVDELALKIRNSSFIRTMIYVIGTIILALCSAVSVWSILAFIFCRPIIGLLIVLSLCLLIMYIYSKEN